MDERSYLERFAGIAMTGLNIQPGQSLAIKVEPENLDAAVIVAEAAYRRGARYVEMWPESTRLTRTRVDHTRDDEYLDFVPGYRRDRNREFVENKWALLSIKSPVDLSVMDGVDAARLGRVAQGIRGVDNVLREALAEDRTQWTVMAVPSRSWAASVLDMPESDEALLAMWRALEPIYRLDHEDPAEYWRHHGEFLQRRSAALEALQIRSLRFQADGTDLTVPLDPDAQWLGGGSETQDGIPFLPNVPTEEVFTAPYAPGVTGHVAVTRPVRVYGALVEGAWFRFEAGEVVEYDARNGRDALEAYLAVDPGSRRLGEVALVDATSPIARSGLVFQNILLDENASCHIALGAAYPTCILGGESMSPGEREVRGLNESTQHTDFMFGSENMNVDAVDGDGNSVRIMEHGSLQV